MTTPTPEELVELAEVKDLLVAAYREGASDVHNFLADLPEDERVMVLRNDCPDLTEGANGCAYAALRSRASQENSRG